ncbi:Factor arrest protein 11 [Dispira simplex]|nr:Factor arrest protein 11 [Dispira simplex]
MTTNNVPTESNRRDTRNPAWKQRPELKKKRKSKAWTFRYLDNDALENALTDYFSYSETPFFEENRRCYESHPQRPTTLWLETTEETRKAFVTSLLETVDISPQATERCIALRTLLYVAQGCFREIPFNAKPYRTPSSKGSSSQSTVYSDSLHMHWINANNQLLRTTGSLAHAHRHLVRITEYLLQRHDGEYLPSTAQPFSTTLIEMELGLWMDLVFVLMEVHQDDPDFAREVLFLRPLLSTVLLLLTPVIHAQFSEGLLLKKYLLLTRRCLLISFGDTEQTDLRDQLASLFPDKPTNRPRSRENDVHPLKCDITQAYAFYAVQSRLFPTFYDYAKGPMNYITNTLRRTDARIPLGVGQPDSTLFSPRGHYYQVLAQDQEFVESMGDALHSFPLTHDTPLVPNWLEEAHGLYQHHLYISPSLQQRFEVSRDFSFVAPQGYWETETTPSSQSPSVSAPPVSFAAVNKLLSANYGLPTPPEGSPVDCPIQPGSITDIFGTGKRYTQRRQFGRRRPWTMLYSTWSSESHNTSVNETMIPNALHRLRIEAIHECYNTVAPHLPTISDYWQKWVQLLSQGTKRPKEKPGAENHSPPLSSTSVTCPQYSTTPTSSRRRSLPTLDISQDPMLPWASTSPPPVSLSSSLPASPSKPLEFPPPTSRAASPSPNPIDPLVLSLFHTLGVVLPEHITVDQFIKQRDYRVRMMALPSIMLILVKGFKVDHSLRGEYLLQCIWDSNVIRTLLSWLTEKQIRIPKEREKLEELGFTAFCSPQSNLWTTLVPPEVPESPASLNSSFVTNTDSDFFSAPNSSPCPEVRPIPISVQSRRSSIASDQELPMSISPTPSQTSEWTIHSNHIRSASMSASFRTQRSFSDSKAGTVCTVPSALMSNPTPRHPLYLTGPLLIAQMTRNRTKRRGSQSQAPSTTSPSSKTARSFTRHFWCSQYTGTTILRLIRKVTKDHPRRLERMKQLKCHLMLERLAMYDVRLVKVYVYKIIQSMVPFMGKDWLDQNMALVSGIYLYVPPRLVDDWMKPYPAAADTFKARDQRNRLLLDYFNAQTLPWHYNSTCQFSSSPYRSYLLLNHLQGSLDVRINQEVEAKFQEKQHDSLFSLTDDECASQGFSDGDMDSHLPHHPTSDGEESREITDA